MDLEETALHAQVQELIKRDRTQDSRLTALGQLYDEQRAELSRLQQRVDDLEQAVKDLGTQPVEAVSSPQVDTARPYNQSPPTMPHFTMDSDGIVVEQHHPLKADLPPDRMRERAEAAEARVTALSETADTLRSKLEKAHVEIDRLTDQINRLIEARRRLVN